MVQISRVQVVVQIVVQTLLVACAQLTTTAAAAPPISCIHSRTQLASVSAAVASLEAQLDEARRRMIAKELEVRQCELNLTTTSQRSGEPRPAQRGRRCKIRLALSPMWPECSLLTARKKRSLRLDGDKAGCNYCLTFQRVSDYALPRSGTSNRPRLAWICATGGACIIEACTASFVLYGTNYIARWLHSC